MMKLKSNQIRTYDGDGFKKRAACLCFRSDSEEEVLLVSSRRHPDKWIVPGGGMEPEEEPNVAAVREVCEEAGVKGTLGRLVGVFENRDRKHRTYVYVLTVTDILEDWEDSVNIGRKREWFTTEDAKKILLCHKPVQASYFEALQSCFSSNMTPMIATMEGDLSTSYSISPSPMSSKRAIHLSRLFKCELPTFGDIHSRDVELYWFKAVLLKVALKIHLKDSEAMSFQKSGSERQQPVVP